uniref:Uncharacterized protein n=1 Tax=Kalanchoe fedtschenkoi TaxID=63787 RepID=A0A7N0SX69_KALFE
MQINYKWAVHLGLPVLSIVELLFCICPICRRWKEAKLSKKLGLPDIGFETSKIKQKIMNNKRRWS